MTFKRLLCGRAWRTAGTRANQYGGRASSLRRDRLRPRYTNWGRNQNRDVEHPARSMRPAGAPNRRACRERILAGEENTEILFETAAGPSPATGAQIARRSSAENPDVRVPNLQRTSAQAVCV